MALDHKSELLEKQLSTLLGLYQHHLDLFLKWMTLYSTIVAGIAVYVFNQQIDPESRKKLPLLIAGASLVAAIGCLIMWVWLKKLESEVRRLSEKLGESHYPAFLGVTMTIAAFIITLLFSVASFLYSRFGTFV
jgi:uncharacterized membrane protein YidH (DUF202 family)